MQTAQKSRKKFEALDIFKRAKDESGKVIKVEPKKSPKWEEEKQESKPKKIIPTVLKKFYDKMEEN